MNAEQVDMARHTLGLPNHHGVTYRNRYVTLSNTPKAALWEALVEAGDAVRYTARDEGYVCYGLTRQGAEKVLAPGERLSAEDFPVDKPPTG